jgi:hypothetical protein
MSTVRLVSAGKMVEEAREKGADVHAPYEFTLAERTLNKAVEESADAEYKASIELAKKAEQYATDAVLVTEGGSRSIEELGKAEDLSDDSPDDGSDLLDLGGSSERPRPTPRPTPEEDDFDDFDDDWEDDE